MLFWAVVSGSFTMLWVYEIIRVVWGLDKSKRESAEGAQRESSDS